MGAYVRVLVGGVRPVRARWLSGGCLVVVQRAHRLSGASGASGVRVGHAGESRLNSLYYGDRQMVHESRPI